jgi:UDP-N-acetylglucosamine 2-epimerase (non-hydrolysing)
VAQGDTTTVLAAGLASFYARIPFGHVEAGLRSGNLKSPFPEEMNRRVVGTLASLHFAPTATARSALLAEGVAAENIYVTGNTIVDALRSASLQAWEPSARVLAELGSPGSQRLILVTAHRREHFGSPFESLCVGLRLLVDRNPDVELAYPVHPNPSVREPAIRLLGNHPRIHLFEPVDYPTLIYLLKRCEFVLTDSGGIQEEAPVFGKPVLVLRRETERPEGIEAGTARLVGTDRDAVVREAERLLGDAEAYQSMARASSPYGDGHAATRIVQAIVRRSGS